MIRSPAMNEQPSILIVDDDHGMLDTLSDILEEKGFRVSRASDGYMAIEMVKKNGVDMVLMDIKMPGINGVETFKELKQIKSDIKVIMMTAYAVEDLLEEARRLNAYVCINKPLDVDNLLTLINEIVLQKNENRLK